jgi:2-polyprenyl-3-methyl-5-hydroxy-6-metoxy-1,4-benzoquinol methylase
VTGVDIAPDAIAIAEEEAQKAYPDKTWLYVTANFFSLDWETMDYDYSACLEFIEHIPSKEVDLIIRLLNDSTRHAVFISTPLENGKYGHIDENGSHINLYSPRRLEEQIKEITGIKPETTIDANFIYTFWYPKGSKHE